MTHSVNLTRFRIFAALALSSLLVACGGGGGATVVPGVLSPITLTASEVLSSGNVAGSGFITTDTVNNLIGVIAVTDTAACAALLTNLGGTASVVASGTTTSIIPLTVSGCTFLSATRTITASERANLLAAASLTLRFVTGGVTYTIALTRS